MEVGDEKDAVFRLPEEAIRFDGENTLTIHASSGYLDKLALQIDGT